MPTLLIGITTAATAHQDTYSIADHSIYNSIATDTGEQKKT